MKLSIKLIPLLMTSVLVVTACSGGSSTPVQSELEEPTPTPEPLPEPLPEDFPPALSTTAQYRVTVSNFWDADVFPQNFPDTAHFSNIGGATHNELASFWEFGEFPTRGITIMAEAGLIDVLLSDDVAPAIDNGTAFSPIDFRTNTPPSVDGVAGTVSFDIEVNFDWPLVTMVTMLAPTPDWFAGISGVSLQNGSGWIDEFSVDSPIYDNGTRIDMTPKLDGDINRPPNPIGYVVYDVPTGAYLDSDIPQMIARFTFTRIDF